MTTCAAQWQTRQLPASVAALPMVERDSNAKPAEGHTFGIGAAMRA